MKKPVKLIINSSQNHEITVGLTGDNLNDTRIIKNEHLHAQTILPQIEITLKDNRVATDDITEINIDTGPGSFTGLRVGMVIAKTIAVLHKIPLNGDIDIKNPEIKYDKSRFDE
jgi:tRNA threonylcarbamoyladenosine biosynthesis protein TsaB